MISRICFLFCALPLCAAPLTVSDNAELETYLRPMKEKAEAGDLATTRQIYLNYGMSGCEEQAKAWAEFFLEQLRAKAEAGETKAMNTLGRAYMLGDDIIKADSTQAVIWYTKASEAGDPSAAFMLADMLTKQGQTDQAKIAYARAYGLYKQQAEQGNREASYWQGYMLLMGLGCEADTDIGRTMLEELAADGYLPAAYQLFKYEAPHNNEKALLYAKQLADDAKDPQMAYFLAESYLADANEEKKKEGRRYLQQAVEGAVAPACYHQALLKEKEGKKKEAYDLYLTAARQGHAESAVKVGSMLLEGKDEATGLSWLQTAADKLRSPVAAYYLGRHYDSIGERELADSWYVVASNRGLAEAMGRRGFLHLNPFSEVRWSPTEAYRWWQLGSQVDDADCKLYLRLYLYFFIPLLLILTFGLPILLSVRLHKKMQQRLG